MIPLFRTESETRVSVENVTIVRSTEMGVWDGATEAVPIVPIDSLGDWDGGDWVMSQNEG